MAKRRQPLNYNENDIERLRLIVQNSFSSKTLSTRAQIILLCIEGLENKQVAEKLQVRPNTVSDTCKRFMDNGIDGLYDRNRVGRRGSENPVSDDIVLSYINEHKNEEIDIETICSELSLPEYTVRRVFRNHCIQHKRTTIWKTDTKDSIIGRYLQLGGIYVSGSVFALIVRALDTDANVSSTGMVISREKTQAKVLKEQTLNDSISLAKALEIASQTTGNTTKAIPFETYLAQMVEADTIGNVNVQEYHIILYQTGATVSVSMEVLKRKIVCHSVNSLPAWHDYVDKVLSVLEPLTGFTSPVKLLSALDSYVNQHLSDPFVWRLVPEDKKETEMTGDASETVRTHVDQVVEIHEGESILLMSGVLLNCKDGKITQTVVNRTTAVPGPDDFDFSSVQGYTATVSAFDDAITASSTSLNNELMGVCLNSHVKKNG